jgi:hypothetical protein
MDIPVQGVTQLRSGIETRIQPRTVLSSLTSLYLARGSEVSKMRSITELCGLRVSVESYVAPRSPLLRTNAASLRICAPVRRMWWLPPLRWVLNPAGAASVLWLRGLPHSELQGLYKVERSEGGPCKASARVCPKERCHEPLSCS